MSLPARLQNIGNGSGLLGRDSPTAKATTTAAIPFETSAAIRTGGRSSLLTIASSEESTMDASKVVARSGATDISPWIAGEVRSRETYVIEHRLAVLQKR